MPQAEGGLPRQPRATEGPPCMFALAREVLVPSFLRRQESRRSVGVKGAPNVRRRPIMRGALGALVGRRADGRSSHRWAVAWIPAYAGMTDRAPTAPTELIFNTVALSLRDISPPPLTTLSGQRKAPLVCSRWLGRCWFRHSCGGRNPGDLWGSRALPMFDGARSCARWGLWWAVGRKDRRTVGRSHGFLTQE